jgi:4'-phosphopantetheinyl transferase
MAWRDEVAYSSSVRPIQPPPAHLIHVWRLRIATAPLATLIPLLSADEIAYAARFVRTEDHDRFVAVRGWLRRLLGAYLDREPAEIAFSHGPQGKPALATGMDGGALRFNVSHSHDMGVLAFSSGGDVGVDVEYIENRFDVLDLARSCFSGDEQHVLQSTESAEQLAMFFRFWTSKEAYIKARGGGLSIPLQDFTIHVQQDSSTWRIALADGSSAPAVVRQLTLPPGYAGAVAADGTDWSISMMDLPS